VERDDVEDLLEYLRIILTVEVVNEVHDLFEPGQEYEHRLLVYIVAKLVLYFDDFKNDDRCYPHQTLFHVRLRLLVDLVCFFKEGFIFWFKLNCVLSHHLVNIRHNFLDIYLLNFERSVIDFDNKRFVHSLLHRQSVHVNFVNPLIFFQHLSLLHLFLVHARPVTRIHSVPLILLLLLLFLLLLFGVFVHVFVVVHHLNLVDRRSGEVVGEELCVEGCRHKYQFEVESFIFLH